MYNRGSKNGVRFSSVKRTLFHCCIQGFNVTTQSLYFCVNFVEQKMWTGCPSSLRDLWMILLLILDYTAELASMPMSPQQMVRHTQALRKIFKNENFKQLIHFEVVLIINQNFSIVFETLMYLYCAYRQIIKTQSRKMQNI